MVDQFPQISGTGVEFGQKLRRNVDHQVAIFLRSPVHQQRQIAVSFVVPGLEQLRSVVLKQRPGVVDRLHCNSMVHRDARS